eukprot:gnl/TRDRNA2_/TRDRNA2_171219_c7_seq2.p1 gnl/TRDRNA2_/TRDRNA2_171219_c7~~gnl/TRDRNA2_/TRDRNA2_171219_c7_seq2.p1  ORF type:complete len:179 (+),score=28.93 gnl/TRDRNA2_/TRDRNA2_171219_c7_seq2:208-744(+)
MSRRQSVSRRKDKEEEQQGSYLRDQEVENLADPRWEKTHIGWDIVPWGLRRILTWIHREYHPPGGIVVTENGCCIKEKTIQDSMNDASRVEYLQGYISQVHQAMELDGVDVRGYFVWSFLDNFEWAYGFSKRFRHRACRFHDASSNTEGVGQAHVQPSENKQAATAARSQACRRVQVV